MSRVPLNRISPRLPAIPITLGEMNDIWTAVNTFPITGNPVLDFRLLIMTGILESGFKSGTIMPPNGESSALGYFQMIKSVRSNISKRIGIPWDNTVATQAKFAAYGYAELARMIRKHQVKVFPFSSDPLANLLLNTRFRYIVGTGSKYLGHRDARSFWAKTMRYYPYLAQGDALSPSATSDNQISNPMNHIKLTNKAQAQMFAGTSRMVPFNSSHYPELASCRNPIYALSPDFIAEFRDLPESVKFTFLNIVTSFTGVNVYISSILTSMNGAKRTKSNGINHSQHKAIDFVVTPYDGPYFIAQNGEIRSPNFHWNKYLQEHLCRMFRNGLIAASVLIEPDHIHIDSNHQPGVAVKDGDKAIYPNLSGFCDHITINRLT